jgi:hypothetical protein
VPRADALAEYSAASAYRSTYGNRASPETGKTSRATCVESGLGLLLRGPICLHSLARGFALLLGPVRAAALLASRSTRRRRLVLRSLRTTWASLDRRCSACARDCFRRPSRTALHARSFRSSWTATDRRSHLREKVLHRVDLPCQLITLAAQSIERAPELRRNSFRNHVGLLA